MLDSLVATFQDNPSLVYPAQQLTFNACLNSIAQSEDYPKLLATSAQDDFWFRDDDWRARYRPYNVQSGVLTIPVKGVLMHNFPWQFGSYGTGYEYVLKAFQRGMSDPNVRGIAFLIHSPGGDVAGCFDAVDKMYSGKSKPVRAFAHEYAYSAAYAIASVADKIVVSRTGGVGSIGVVTAHVDYSKALDQEGVKVTFIKFGAHKTDGNPYEPLPKDVKDRMQSRIDALGEVFVSCVARNRKMDAEKVRATEALTYTASEAIQYGLADLVGPLDDAVAAFAADLETALTGDEQMSDTKPAAVDQAAVDAARNEGLAAGATAERERISTILDSDVAKLRPSAARMMVTLGVAADKALAELAKLPEEKPSSNGSAKADTGAQFKAAVEEGAPKLTQGDDAAQPPSRTAAVVARMGWKK